MFDLILQMTSRLNFILSSLFLIIVFKVDCACRVGKEFVLQKRKKKQNRIRKHPHSQGNSYAILGAFTQDNLTL